MTLDAKRIQEIEAIAHDVLLEVNQGAEFPFPVDLTKILSKYGIHLQVASFNDENIVGAYDKQDKKIYISSDDIYQRQAFTIAHELGHYLLHKDKANELFYRTNELRLHEEDQKVETEANWFAASLLMPKQAVISAWSTLKSIHLCATYFGVSNSAMQYRLHNLNLI